MRRLMSLAVVVAAALVTPAHAAPEAQEAYGATLSVRLDTARGAYVLQLLGSKADSAGSAPQLRVRLMDPRGAAVRLVGVPASFSTTASKVQLRARLGRTPLRVSWVDDGSTAASVGSHEGEDSSFEGWSVWGEAATARITVGSLTCAPSSAVLGRAVIYSTAGYGGPLSRGFGSALRDARCAAPEKGLLG